MLGLSAEGVIRGISKQGRRNVGSQVRGLQKMSAGLTRIATFLSGAALIAAAAIPANAQAFADRISALVDYSKAELEPTEDCTALNNFKSPDIAQIMAAMMPASAAAPTHCRVTGLLSPEIAFEVSLPAK